MQDHSRAARSSVQASALRLPGWAQAGLIGVLTGLVYLPVLQAGYLWDDDTALTDNPLLQSLSGLRDIWFSTKPFDYFPLTFTSFWLERWLWGLNPTGYHVVNVLLHATGAILFWRVLLRLEIPGAWLAATVFAVHPVGVASVAWVAERKNTLSLVFYLLSLLWYLRSEGEIRDSRPRSRWYWLSLFAFLLALLSKTSGVTLPLVMLACTWWQRRAEWAGAPARWLPALWRLAPFFALALVLGLVTVWFQSHRAMSGDLYVRDKLGVRLLGGSWAAWFYLGKAILPLQLSMIYPRWAIQPASLTAYVPALLGLGVFGVCWRFRRAWGAAGLFGLGCFLATLLPVLGFFDMSFFVYARAADHLQYLALLSVVALGVGAVCSRAQTSGLLFRLAAGAVVGALSVLTWQRARVFNSQETLWRDTLAKNPEAWAAWNNLGMATRDPVEEFNCYTTALRLNPNYVEAHNNLGVVLYQNGKVEDAIAHFREALRLHPGNAFAHSNLGGVLSNQGKLEEALDHLRQAVQIKPNHADAHNNLGLVLLRLGRTAEAARSFATSLQLNPQNPETHQHLGNLAHAQGRFGDAAAHYQAALRIRPDSLEMRHNLGVALAAAGQTGEAFTQFDLVLKVKPDFAPAQYQIGELLLKQGRRAEAAGWFAAAARNQPDSAEAHQRLGLVLAAEQKPGEAITHLREAVRLRPDWADALEPLAWLLSTQPDATHRDATTAVRLAAQANQLTGGTNANVLDTLAAARAEAGEFTEATRAAQRALALARAAGNTNLAAQIESRLHLYATGQPFRGKLKAEP